MSVDLQSEVTDLTTATLVKSVAIGVAERIAIIAGTWLVTNKLLPADQLTSAETLIGTSVLAAAVFWLYLVERKRPISSDAEIAERNAAGRKAC